MICTAMHIMKMRYEDNQGNYSEAIASNDNDLIAWLTVPTVSHHQYGLNNVEIECNDT